MHRHESALQHYNHHPLSVFIFISWHIFYHYKRFNSKIQRLHFGTLCTQRPRSLQYLVFYFYFYFLFFFLCWFGFYGREYYGFWHSLGFGYILKRIDVCIAAFSYQRLIFGTLERGNGREGT